MKKTILLTALALGAAVPAFAQHAGQGGIGVNIGVSPVIEGKNSPTHFTLGGRVQYSFTDLIRATADFNYGFPSKGLKVFDAVANVNFMVPVSPSFYVYPLAGVGCGRVSGHDWNGGNPHWDRFVFDIGLGAEYEFDANWAAGAEFKYRYMKDFGALPVMVNVSYKF